MSEEVAREVPATQKVVVRRVRTRRVTAEGFEGIERLNRVCKSIAIAAILTVIGVGLFGRFYVARFSYLPTVAALEQAEIARQLREGKGFTTRIGHPLALDKTVDKHCWHDVTYNPVYPFLLSLFFRVRGSADSSVAHFNGLIYLLTGLLVYLITTRLRGRRTGILAVILYFGSIEAIASALNGMGVSLAAFFVTLGIWAALKCRELQSTSEHPSLIANWGWPLLVGVIFGLAYLVGGLTILVIVPAAALLAGGLAHVRRNWALVFAAFVITLLPWAARNFAVSRTLSPLLTQYELLTWTDSHPAFSVYRKTIGEVESPVGFVLSHPGEIVKKFAAGVTAQYRSIPSFLNPYLFPLVLLLGLWGNAANVQVRRVWWLLLVMIALQVFTSAFYNYNPEYLKAFLPVGICLATLAAVNLITQYAQRPVWQLCAVVGLIGLVLFPYATSLVFGGQMPPQYVMPNLAQLNAYLAEDALIATDVPSAVAWYTHKPTVMLPSNVKGIEGLAKQQADPDYIYLSSNLAEGPPTEWLRVLTGRVKKDEAKLLGTLIRGSPGGELLLQRHQKLAEGVRVEKKAPPGPETKSGESNSQLE